jgi:hypothetical protein
VFGRNGEERFQIKKYKGIGGEYLNIIMSAGEKRKGGFYL